MERKGEGDWGRKAEGGEWKGGEGKDGEWKGGLGKGRMGKGRMGPGRERRRKETVGGKRKDRMGKDGWRKVEGRVSLENRKMAVKVT